jgi:hypothetical protein
VDDDAFVVVPNVPLLLEEVKNDRKFVIYSEACAQQAGIVFPCGGGGFLVCI